MTRFSLRTLIVVMVFGGPVCAWAWREWVMSRERVAPNVVSGPVHKPRQPTPEEFIQALRGNSKRPLRSSANGASGSIDEVKIIIVDRTFDE